MSADPKEWREQAKRCLRLAAEANDPFLETALRIPLIDGSALLRSYSRTTTAWQGRTNAKSG